MFTDVDARECTRGLYGHRKWVCTENLLWKKNPLLHRGLELCQYSSWLFSRTLYQLSYPRPQCIIRILENRKKINNSFLSVCLFFIWEKEKPQALVNLTDLYCKLLCSTVKYSCAIRYTGSTANRGSLQLWCDSNFAKHFDNIVQPFHNCLNYYIQCIAGSGMKITLWPGHWAGYLKRKNIIVWLDTFHVIVCFM